jgi:hypothetical protein
MTTTPQEIHTSQLPKSARRRYSLMSYFMLDIKRVYRNKIVLTVLAALVLVMIIEPISVRLQELRYPNYFEGIGKNPFQFWILMNSSGWGNGLFNTLFFVFPIIFGSMHYYDERNTSVQILLYTRKNRSEYFLSKILSTFLCACIAFISLLAINGLATYMLFPENAPFTDYHRWVVPNKGTFAYDVYTVSPILMIGLYSLLNAMAIAIFAVFYLVIQMVFKFKNRYIALIVPLLLMYIIAFLFDSQIQLYRYNIRLIIQPRAANAITEIIQWHDVILTYAGWMAIVIALMLIGLVRNRESI